MNFLSKKMVHNFKPPLDCSVFYSRAVVFFYCKDEYIRDLDLLFRTLAILDYFSMASPALRIPDVVQFSLDFFESFKLHADSVLDAGICGDIVLSSLLEQPDSKFIVKMFSLLDKEKLERNKDMLEQEVKFMQSLDHPFLTKCNLAATCPEYSGICMKYYYRGTLSEYMGNIDLELSELCIIQVACGLRYLHKNNLVHLDVKLSNVFVDQDFNAVLGDFGLAVEMEPQQQTLAIGYIGGTSGYYAPEYKRATADVELDPYKLDSYSHGVMLWCLAFEIGSEDCINYYYRTKIRQDLKPNIRAMLLRLVQGNPARRLTVADFLDRVRQDSIFRHVIDSN